MFNVSFAGCILSMIFRLIIMLVLFRMREPDYVSMNRCEECLWRLDPTKDPVEFLRCLSFLCFALGALFIMIGFLVPVDYEMDFSKPAREMEAIEQYYYELVSHLESCVMAGIALITISGIVMVVTMVAVMRQQTCDTIFCLDAEEETEMQTISMSQEITTRATYGTQNKATTVE